MKKTASRFRCTYDQREHDLDCDMLPDWESALGQGGAEPNEPQRHSQITTINRMSRGGIASGALFLLGAIVVG